MIRSIRASRIVALSALIVLGLFLSILSIGANRARGMPPLHSTDEDCTVVVSPGKHHQSATHHHTCFGISHSANRRCCYPLFSEGGMDLTVLPHHIPTTAILDQAGGTVQANIVG